jgi:hypothetical protein
MNPIDTGHQLCRKAAVHTAGCFSSTAVCNTLCLRIPRHGSRSNVVLRSVFCGFRGQNLFIFRWHITIQQVFGCFWYISILLNPDQEIYLVCLRLSRLMQNTSVRLPWIEHQVFVLEPKKPGQTPHVFMDTTRRLTLLDWLKSFSMFLPSDNILYIYI